MFRARALRCRPLPRHPLRNGHLNQMAYSLFLFMRDVADDDFVGWIDRQLGAVDPHSPDRLPALREAIFGPLRNVYGVADKVLAMALSSLLLGAGKRRPLWVEVGATFVAVEHPGPTRCTSHLQNRRRSLGVKSTDLQRL